jgi:hypothetical protein
MTIRRKRTIRSERIMKQACVALRPGKEQEFLLHVVRTRVDDRYPKFPDDFARGSRPATPRCFLLNRAGFRTASRPFTHQTLL